MINLLKTLCQEDEMVEIWVGTSNDNGAAKRLYASTGAMLESGDNAEFIYTVENSAAVDRM